MLRYDVDFTSCACSEQSAEAADSESYERSTGACGDTSLMLGAWSCVRWLMSNCCVYHKAALSDTAVKTCVPSEVGHIRTLTHDDELDTQNEMIFDSGADASYGPPSFQRSGKSAKADYGA